MKMKIYMFRKQNLIEFVFNFFLNFFIVCFGLFEYMGQIAYEPQIDKKIAYEPHFEK